MNNKEDRMSEPNRQQDYKNKTDDLAKLQSL